MKILKRILIVIIGLGLVFYFFGMPYLRNQTKKHSPEKTAVYQQTGFDLRVNYCSPSKKGRQIFGSLVPYNQVWRTGANEATTFFTASPITVIDKKLPAGTFSLWTIPGEDQWTVIFNEEIPDWGVTLLSGGAETTRNPEADVIQVIVPVRTQDPETEEFTIGFSELNDQLYLLLSWDQARVEVPLNR